MNNYEIESKLAQKADKWELNNLKSENNDLRQKMNTLNEQVGRLQSQINTKNTVLENLLNLLLEHEQFTSLQNEIHNIKSNLY